MWYLIVYIGILVAGIITKFYFSEVWKWFSLLDTSSAVALSLLAGWGYIEYIKNEQEIKIFFDVDGQKIDTRLSILRKNFSRAEIQGLLRMISTDPRGGYEIRYIKDPAILVKIHKIQKGKGKEFLVKMTKDELKQFNI